MLFRSDAPYKYEIYAILEYCFDNYKDCNCYIIKYLDRCSPPKEDECYIDECDDPNDSFEISLFDEIAACDTCAHDTTMNETCKNDFATVIYDNPCYFDRSYDNPLFIPTIDMHDDEEICLQNLYDNALDDGPMLLDVINYNATENRIAIMCPIPFKRDQSSCYNIAKSGFGEVKILSIDPTILELNMNYVLLDHDKHALCDSYVVEFVHDATENYYKREENMVVEIFMLLKHLSFC